MTTDDSSASFSLKETTLLDDAHTLGFRTVNWIEPPLFASQPPENDQERYSLRPIMIAPPRTLLRTYSGILPKRHGILVELNET